MTFTALLPFARHYPLLRGHEPKRMFVVFGIPPSVPSQTPATEMGQSTFKWSLAPMDDVVESRCTSLTVGIQKAAGKISAFCPIP